MKSKKMIGFFILFLGVSNTMALADGFPKGPWMKLSRGLANMGTAPMEYLAQYSDFAREQHNPAVSFAGGTVYGTFFAVARVVTGALEVVTFPFPVPADYGPIMDPPTAYESYKEYKRY